MQYLKERGKYKKNSKVVLQLYKKQIYKNKGGIMEL